MPLRNVSMTSTVLAMKQMPLLQLLLLLLKGLCSAGQQQRSSAYSKAAEA